MLSNTQIYQALGKILEIYKDEKRWTQLTREEIVRGGDGKPSYCIRGAINIALGRGAYDDPTDWWDIEMELRKYTPNHTSSMWFNDKGTTTIDDIRKLVQKARDDVKARITKI